MAPGDLLTTLARAGLRVGVVEAARLQQVLSGGADLGDLRDIVAAVVIKDREELPRFEQAFAAWLLTQGREEAADGPRLRILPGPQQRPRRLSRIVRRVGPALGVLAVLGAAIGAGWRLRPLREVTAPPLRPWPTLAPPPPEDVVAPPPDQTAPRKARGPFSVHVPELKVLSDGPRPSRAPEAASAAALAIGAALLLLSRRRLRLPEPDRAPPQPGPAPVLPQAPVPAGGPPARILSPRDEEALVWGIGRFVSDEATRHLDLPASISATAAAAGLPAPRFQQARHQREVWLWVDAAAGAQSDPRAGSLGRLADEVERSLRRAGLPVERAGFWGMPAELLPAARRDGAGPFAPAEVEDRKGAAVVAVLTDGRILRGRLTDEVERRRTAALLRQLAGWPRLCFVDFGRGAHDLVTQLRPFGLQVILPEGLPAFLAGSAAAGAGAAPADERAVRAWAAACALCPYPVDEESAYGLARALQLAPGPFAMDALRAEAGRAGGRLHFPRRRRAELLRWLLVADAGGLRRGALAFFRRQLDDEGERRARAERTQAFRGTLAERQLLRDRALLDLWDAPEAASRALWDLYDGPQVPTIREHLDGLVPAEGAADEERAPLPWRWRERSVRCRQLLVEMGMGGGRWRPGEVRAARPGRLHLALGLCSGIAAAGMMAVARREAPGRPEVRRDATQQWGEVRVYPSDDVRIRVVAWNINGRQEIHVDRGSTVAVTWAEVERDECPHAEEQHDGMTFVHVCGGEFMMGSTDEDKHAESDEKPAYRVRLSEFWIGKHEVSADTYLRAAKEDPLGGHLPASRMDWTEATRFCGQAGGDLPTEAQWEYAARGPEGRRYPWGEEPPTPERAVYAGFTLSPEPVNSHPRGTGPFGALHQAGNLWEWVRDCYVDDIYRTRVGSLMHDPSFDKKTCSRRVVRGGSFGNGPRDLRSASRGWSAPVDRDRFLGFRCVRGARLQP